MVLVVGHSKKLLSLVVGTNLPLSVLVESGSLLLWSSFGGFPLLQCPPERKFKTNDSIAEVEATCKTKLGGIKQFF